MAEPARFDPAPLLAASCLGLATPTIADASDAMTGVWCHPEWGAALFWDEHAIGLGEHRMCDWASPPGDALSYETELACRTVYLHDDQVIELDHKTHVFRAALQADGGLRVWFDGDDPIVMTRCDD